jgi:hypothetical protein
MAFDLQDPYPSLTLLEVLAAYKDLQKEMMSGKTLIGAGSGDVNSQKMVSESFKQREDLFRQSLYAKDPVTYASYAEIGQNVTLVAFS